MSVRTMCVIVGGYVAFVIMWQYCLYDSYYNMCTRVGYYPGSAQHASCISRRASVDRRARGSMEADSLK